jgi:hypothetical protein
MKTIKQVIDHARKGTNVSYRAVVTGKMPSRKDRAEQRYVNQMSRHDLEEYWLKRLEETRE